MALVDYASDSESDSDSPPAPLPPPKPSSGLAALLPKPKTRPGQSSTPSLISKSDSTAGAPRKIVVNLPKASELADGDDTGESRDEPPSKRARTGGGLGGGLAAMLPAPKRSGAGIAKPADSTDGKKTRVLGGAAAKKEDEGLVVPMEESVYVAGNGAEDDAEFGPLPVAEKEKEKVQEDGEKKESIGATTTSVPVTKFVPQSVARKTIQPMSAFRKKVSGSGNKGRTTGGAGGATAVAAPKPVEKVSLFGAAPVYTPPPAPKAANPSEYKPLLVSSLEPAPAEATQESTEDTYTATYEETTQSYYNEANQQPPADDLEAIARQAGLDDAALRQLRGRGNRNAPIKIIDFNVEAVYNENEQARQLGLAQPAVNPVRSIAPGRHQLTSLLNAAQAQKTALEEHFAQGKRNKKEAGSKYGW